MSSLKKKIFIKKNLLQNLLTVFGVGTKTARASAKVQGLQPNIRYNFLREDQIVSILSYIEIAYRNIETNLMLQKKEYSDYLNKVKNIRSIRNKTGFPSRGQRTHTNARTKKKLKN